TAEEGTTSLWHGLLTAGGQAPSVGAEAVWLLCPFSSLLLEWGWFALPMVFPLNLMKTAEVIETSQGQAVRLPDEFRFPVPIVSIRREGEAVILEPLKPSTWPEGFFDAIRIDDPAFTRPSQGSMPPAPLLD